MPSSQMAALTARRKSVLDYPRARVSAASRNEEEGQTTVRRSRRTSISIRQLGDEPDGDGGHGRREVHAGRLRGALTRCTKRQSVKAFSDIVVMAFSCDVTRSVAMSWAADGGSAPYTMPFLNLGNPDSMLAIGEVHASRTRGPRAT